MSIKKLLRLTAINLYALWLASQILPTMSFSEGLKTYLAAAIALTIFEFTLKPIAKFLFLPINILTLGLLRWWVNVFGLYLVVRTVDGFQIQPYFFPGISWETIIIAPVSLSLFATYILTSFFLSFTINIISWIMKK